MDFTQKKYTQLLKVLQQQGFSFQSFQEYIEKSALPPTPRITMPYGRQEFGTGSKGESLPSGNLRAAQKNEKNPTNKCIVLRHDVDKLPENSLRFAQIQHELGITGSYYFRIVPESFNPKIIEKIAGLGHEIGSHYENLTTDKKN